MRPSSRTSRRLPPNSSLRLGTVAAALTAGLGIVLAGATAGATGPSDGGLVTLTVTGTIERVAVDDATPDSTASPDDEVGTTTTDFVDVDGELFALPDGTAIPAAPAGGDVVVTLVAPPGVTAEAALELAADEVPNPEARVVEVALAPDATTAAPAATGDAGEGTADVVLGTHTLTILPVYWYAQDSATTQTLTTLAADTADYWTEQSGGRLTFARGARAWQGVPDPGSCSSAALGSLFNAALAANPGVAAPSETNHVAVYFPYRSDCGFAGRASITGGWIWVNGSTVVDVLAHELGHNLGLGHANTRTCVLGATRVPLSASCTSREYEDRADVMGIGMSQRSGNLNSALSDALGFAVVTPVDATGVGATGLTVDLSPLGLFGANRAVKVAVPGGVVFLDFRPAVGRDLRRPAWAGVQAHLRTTSAGGTPTTYLLDLQSPQAAEFATPQLPAAARWAIPDTGLTVTVTSIGATVRITVTREDVTRYVTRVYRDLFDRTPDPQGLQGWTAALTAGTPRVGVANAITYSDEYRSGLINGSYRDFLARTADPGGLQSWLHAMGAGMTIQQMESGFLASQEYYNQSGGDDAEWVRRLYRHVLGRDAGPAEVAWWVATVRTPGVSRAQVAMGFLLSTERLAAVVDGHYQHLLGRGIDPSGRTTWVGLIQGGARIEAIIGGIIASEEYYGRL